MTVSSRTKAHIIIHSCAVASAAWAAAWALVPVAGPLLADTAGLTAITVAMVLALSGLHERRLAQQAVWTTVATTLGFTLGNAAVKAFASLIPIFGSGVNATITFALTEGIGWGLNFVFEEDLDPTTLTRDQLKSYVERGKRFAEEVNKSGEFSWIGNLPPHINMQYEKLTRKLADNSIAEAERTAILREIDQLLEPYAPH